jgi:hypothetical protein
LPNMRYGSQLRTDDERISKGDCPHPAGTCQDQARLSRDLPFDLARALEADLTVVRVSVANGARMPSIADELATDRYTDSRRIAGSSR